MIKITFLGDIMCDNEMSRIFTANGTISSFENYNGALSHIKGLLGESDYVIANLETPIALRNDDLTQKQWEFNSSIEFAKAVKENGVDFVSTANNHCLDRGMTGLMSTEQSLKEVGLEQCGINVSNHKRYRIVEVNGIRFGIISYTYGTNAFSNGNYLSFKDRKAVNLLQEQEEAVKKLWIRLFHGHLIRIYNKLETLIFPDNFNKDIYEKETIDYYRKLLVLQDVRTLKRKKVDHLISLIHVGGQYNSEPSGYTKKVVNWLVKHNSDIVICNHEHVIHNSFWNKKAFAAYALGNCLGSAGVCRKPFDKRSEYSIAVHLYFSEKSKELKKVTFSVLKTILIDECHFQVWPVVDLLNECDGNDKERLFSDCLMAAKDFSGMTYYKIDDEFEYLLN